MPRLSNLLAPMAAFVVISTSAYAADCQSTLEDAVSKLTTSGPVRVQMSTRMIASGDSVSFGSYEFVPPDLIKKSPPSQSASGMTEIMAGGVMYTRMGSDAWEKQEGDPPGTAPRDTMLLSSFAHPHAYYAASCSASEITYTFDVQGVEVADLQQRIAARDTARAKMNEMMSKVGGKPLPIRQGSMTIDPSTGRPLKFSHNVSGSTDVMEDYTVTYDPAIKIEIPKVP